MVLCFLCSLWEALPKFLSTLLPGVGSHLNWDRWHLLPALADLRVFICWFWSSALAMASCHFPALQPASALGWQLPKAAALLLNLNLPRSVGVSHPRLNFRNLHKTAFKWQQCQSRGQIFGLLWRNPSGRLGSCRLQEGLLVPKASVITFKGLSSSHLSVKAKVPLHRIRGCSSAQVPSLWFSGRINKQQISVSEFPETDFKKIRASLGHVSSFEMEASPFAFSSEHFWHRLLVFFFPFLSHGYTWAWKWMWNLWVCFSWAEFKICLGHLINLVKSTQFQNSVPLLENFQFWEGMSSVCHHLEF